MPPKEDGRITQTVMLTVTDDCNLRCRYCFELDKNPRVMDPVLMREIVSRHVTPANEFTEVVFDIPGGEPLLVFDRIRDLIDWFHQQKWQKSHLFSIGTNATLLEDDMKAWFASHHDCVVLCTSLDGTKEAHDLNRCNSYDAVVRNVPFLVEHWPDQAVKMTINADTIHLVAEGVKNIHALGLLVEANVIFEDGWGSPESKRELLEEYTRQLETLVEFYTEHPELAPPRLVNKYLPVVLRGGGPESRYCGAGKYMVSYDVDGRAYPCHRFTPLGSRRPAVDPYAREESALFLAGPDRCQDCLISSICPTCQGHNWEVHGNVDYRTTSHCEFVKLEVLASAKLAFNRLKPRLLDLPLKQMEQDREVMETLLHLESIKKIFQEMKV